MKIFGFAGSTFFMLLLPFPHTPCDPVENPQYRKGRSTGLVVLTKSRCCIAQHLIAHVLPFVKSSVVIDFAQSLVLSEQVVIYLFF